MLKVVTQYSQFNKNNNLPNLFLPKIGLTHPISLQYQLLTCFNIFKTPSRTCKWGRDPSGRGMIHSWANKMQRITKSLKVARLGCFERTRTRLLMRQEILIIWEMLWRHRTWKCPQISCVAFGNYFLKVREKVYTFLSDERSSLKTLDIAFRIFESYTFLVRFFVQKSQRLVSKDK